MVYPVVMYACESWTIKKAECWRIDAFELWCWRRLLEIQSVHPKGNQSWIFIGRTDAEAPILWSPDAKSWLIGKASDAGKDWGQEEKWVTEDEMVGWHHWLNGYEFEQTPGKSDMLQSMGLQRVEHKLATAQQQQLSEWHFLILANPFYSPRNNRMTTHKLVTWVFS